MVWKKGFALIEIAVGIVVILVIASTIFILYRDNKTDPEPPSTPTLSETESPTATPTPFPSPTPWPTVTPNPYPIKATGTVNIHVLRFIDNNNDDFTPTSTNRVQGVYETTDIIFSNQDFFYQEIHDPGGVVIKDHVLYLPFIKTYFEREAKKYGANLTINIDMPEPIRVDGVEYFGFDAEFQTRTAVKNFYTTKAAEKGYSFTSPDLYVFVLLNPKRDPMNNYHAFQSFAERYEGMAFVDFAANVGNINASVQTAIHEIGHLFNADDTYGKQSLFAGCDPQAGLPEPNKNPLYPQNAMCLMCPRFMITEKGAGNTNDELNYYHSIVDDAYQYEYMVVCSEEAKRFGWK